MNPKIKQKIISILTTLLAVGVTGLWIYWAFFWHNSQPIDDVKLLPPPIEELADTTKTDYIVIGTNSNYRIDLTFEKGKLNPYPYGISRGTITIIDNSTGDLAPINGALKFRVPDITVIKNRDGQDDHRIKDVALINGAVSLAHGYVEDLQPIPFRYGPLSWCEYEGLGFCRLGLGLIIKNGVGEFEYVNIRRNKDFVNFDFYARELALNGTLNNATAYMLVPPNRKVSTVAEIDEHNYDKNALGNLVRTNKYIPFGAYEDFDPPGHIASKTVTSFDYYYDIISNPEKIVRSENREFTITIVPKPLGDYSLPDTIHNYMGIKILPAYEVSGGVTYPARIYSATDSAGEILYDWETYRASINRSGGEPGEIKAAFKINEKPLTIKLQMTDEPTHIPFVELQFEVSGMEKDTRTMAISKFIPIKIESDIPSKIIALGYLLAQASEILLGGVLISWLQYRHRRKHQFRIDKKPKI